MADVNLRGRWDLGGSSQGQQQQQQQQHAGKKPAVFKQLPPPQQPAANGAPHMQGIFSSGTDTFNSIRTYACQRYAEAQVMLCSHCSCLVLCTDSTGPSGTARQTVRHGLIL